MGEVWRATDTNLGRQVAIKVVPDVFAQDAERLARFEREAKTLAALNHLNIAAIFTKDNKDTRGGWEGERAQAIRAFSRAVWRYYHPNEKWSPPAGVEKY